MKNKEGDISTCPHIRMPYDQKDGQIIYDKEKTLYICKKCVNQIIARGLQRKMDFSDYQEQAGVTATYPQEFGVEYTTLGLIGEAGEIANKVKKVMRGDYSHDDIRGELKGEIGDVLWYISRLASELGFDLGDIAQSNLDKLADRKERGVIRGSGDDR